MKPSHVGIALAAACLPAAAFAEDRNEIERASGGGALWSFGAGVETSTSKIGRAAEQEVLYFPVSIGVSVGGWSFGAETGYLDGSLRVNSADRAVTIPSIGGRPARTITLPGVQLERSANGIADTVVSARYDFAPIADSVAVALAGDVKIPTADKESGLGTGEVDTSLSAEIGALGLIAPYLGLGVQMLGEPEGAEYDQPLFGYLGLDAAAGESWLFSLVYDYEQAVQDGLDDSSSVSATARWRLTERVRLSATAAAGLSDTAPESRFALRLSLRSR